MEKPAVSHPRRPRSAHPQIRSEKWRTGWDCEKQLWAVFRLSLRSRSLGVGTLTLPTLAPKSAAADLSNMGSFTEPDLP
jgi:hypothetical protein